MEQIDYNLLFRRFVGLEMDAAVWHPTVFTHNRDRLLEAEVARAFLSDLLALRPVKRLLSSDHFSVDGTLIEARASMKSFRPKDGSGGPPGPGRERDFRRETRSNETHASTTDPDARLSRKSAGQESRLCDMGHVPMENRNGLVVDAMLTHATGIAEREATLTMLDRRPHRHRITLGADKAYDVRAFVGDLRARRVTPHIAINAAVSKTGKVRRTAIGCRTTRHPGYAISLRCRKRVKEVFGWIKVKLRSKQKVEAVFTFAAAAYDLVRLPKLLAKAAGDGKARGQAPPPKTEGLPKVTNRTPSTAPVTAKTADIAHGGSQTRLLPKPASSPASAARSFAVSVLGRWRIVEPPGYESDHANMVEKETSINARALLQIQSPPREKTYIPVCAFDQS